MKGPPASPWRPPFVAGGISEPRYESEPRPDAEDTDALG